MRVVPPFRRMAERIAEEGDVISGMRASRSWSRSPQPEPRHQRFHPCLRHLGIAGSAADHEIVRIIDE